MSYSLQPGYYWIGDPCYVLSEENYDELLKSVKDDGLVLQKGENTSIALYTDHGDGEYDVLSSLYNNRVTFLSERVKLAVDSGLIAITSIELVEDISDYDEPVGIKVEVLEPISIYNLDGVLRFGSVIIDTNYEDKEIGFEFFAEY